MKKPGITKTTLFQSRTAMYRLYCALASALFPLLYISVPAEMNDPFWLRMCVGGYFITVLGLSFVLQATKKHIASLTSLGMLIATSWLTWLLYANSFRDEYLSPYFIMAFASALIFESRRFLLFFSLYNVAILIVAATFVKNPEFAYDSFFSLAISIYVVSYLAIGSRLRVKEQLEKGLDKSRIVQESAINTSRDAMLLVDEHGNFVKYNDAFIQIWDMPVHFMAENLLEEAMGHSETQVKDPLEFRQFLRSAETNPETGKRLEVKLKDGRFLDCSWLPMRLKHEPIGRMWIFRDISEQKKVEQGLIAAEKQLRLHNERLMEITGSHALASGDIHEAYDEITRVSAELLNVDTVGIWFFDDDDLLMECAKLYRRSTKAYESGASMPLAKHSGYFEAVRQNRVLTVNDTRDKDITAAFYDGSYTGRAIGIVHAQIRISGRLVGIVTFEDSEKPRQWTLEDQSYAAAMADLVAVSLEASQRLAAQEELENSVAVLQAIFDLSETGIVVEDNNHGIIQYNELYLEIWNLTKAFLEATPYEELVPYLLGQIHNSQSYEVGLERLKIRPGMEYAGIIEFKDGRFVERYSKAVNVGGEIVGRCWFYLDITDRKKKENELINRNFELDSFVYRASHDLKAPLNSIMGLIDIIRAEKELPRIISYVAMMDKSVKKLDAFIRQLTQFSQDTRLKIVRQPIRFQEMVDSCLHDLKYMEKASRVKVTINVDQNVEFQSDPVRLGIVFNNLISNAIKYQDIEKEEPTLEVDIHVDESKATCRFADNGLGIDSEHMEKVFDLFFRASIQATGSGLGLYITHNAVQKLGGEIKVESHLGTGTAFTLIVPNRKQDEEE